MKNKNNKLTISYLYLQINCNRNNFICTHTNYKDMHRHLKLVNLSISEKQFFMTASNFASTIASYQNYIPITKVGNTTL